MTQLKITLDESQVPMVTEYLAANHIPYEPVREPEKKRDWSKLPTIKGGGKLDHVNIRDYANEDGQELLNQLPISNQGPNLDQIGIRQDAYEQ